MEKDVNIFDDLIKKSYDFEGAKYYGNPQWELLRDLYINNFLSAKDRNYDTLPKKIHQVWLGGTIPDAYKRFADTWSKVNPDWEYRLWGDNDVNDVDIPRRNVFNAIKNLGQKSDFLRYHILNQFGGLYIDTDFECLKSFNDFTYLNFFTGVGYPRNVELYIGLIACTPHHPIMEHIIKSMTHTKDGHWRDMFNTTGSYFFTKCFLDVVKDARQEGIVAFPTDYFYPFPNQYGHEQRNGRNYVTNKSYALHHWAVSWGAKK